METIYDWTTLALFCVLALLFLERSTGVPVPNDRAVFYLPPALACVAANALGNDGHGQVAAVVIVAAIVYVALILKPWIRPD